MLVVYVNNIFKIFFSSEVYQSEMSTPVASEFTLLARCHEIEGASHFCMAEISSFKDRAIAFNQPNQRSRVTVISQLRRGSSLQRSASQISLLLNVLQPNLNSMGSNPC
jgi:hypothetical protein